VPNGWEHPRDSNGRYIPLLDADYETAANEWIANFIAWENGADTLPDGDIVTGSRKHWRYYWKYAGNPPKSKMCRPKWGEGEATHYQIYATISESVPISPVFESLDAMIVWLVSVQGYSQDAAEQFARTGWVMSAEGY